LSRVSGPQKKERDQCIVADRSTLQERKGALRMRLRGRCNNNGVLVSSEFAILCTDNLTEDKFTNVFGYVVQGMNICEDISRLDPARNRIGIRSCGIVYDSLKK
jgi:cyclophilin family peptidyl-prolyl cis-trans isomerase